MKKNYSIAVATLIILAGVIACRKHHHDNSAISVQNLSGVYQVKSLIGNYNGGDRGDKLSDCQRNNEIELNTQSAAKLTDVTPVCITMGNDNGAWFLSNDSLVLSKTLGGYIDGGKIKSFDGKTLVLFYNLESNYTVTATWVKK